jgi:phosphopantothenoylcysteine decarboxylase/phosphopantothenate--cysteine ligase
MPNDKVVYLMISGALTAYRAPELVAGLGQHFDQVFTVQTPNAQQLISPRDLVRIPNNNVIESYFDVRILPRPTPGAVLFAPCNFNSLNKLAHGIADNLALSITAEMIGFKRPILVALSLNEPLFAHPIVRPSINTLRSWGVTVIEPRDAGEGFMMAPTSEILAAL